MAARFVQAAMSKGDPMDRVVGAIGRCPMHYFCNVQQCVPSSMTRRPLDAKDVKCRVLYMPISHNSETAIKKKIEKLLYLAPQLSSIPFSEGVFSSTRPFKSIQC